MAKFGAILLVVASVFMLISKAGRLLDGREWNGLPEPAKGESDE